MVRIERATGTRGARRAAAAEQLVVAEVAGPPPPSARRHACSSQSPPMFLSSRVVPHDAAFVREVEIARACGDDRRRQLGAEQRPGARAEKRASCPPRDTDATADPVSWQAGATTGVPASARTTLGSQTRRAPCPARRAAAAAASAVRARSSRSVAHVRVRASTNCVVVAIGEFGAQLAGEPVVQQIGDRARATRAASMSCGVALARRVELIQRVERQELDAGDRVDLVARHALEHRLHRRRRCACRGSDTDSRAGRRCSPSERVVAAPGVDADAVEPACRRRARARAASRARAGGCPSAASRSAGPARSGNGGPR